MLKMLKKGLLLLAIVLVPTLGIAQTATQPTIVSGNTYLAQDEEQMVGGGGPGSGQFCKRWEKQCVVKTKCGGGRPWRAMCFRCNRPQTGQVARKGYKEVFAFDVERVRGNGWYCNGPSPCRELAGPSGPGGNCKRIKICKWICVKPRVY